MVMSKQEGVGVWVEDMIVTISVGVGVAEIIVRIRFVIIVMEAMHSKSKRGCDTGTCLLEEVGID